MSLWFILLPILMISLQFSCQQDNQQVADLQSKPGLEQDTAKKARAKKKRISNIEARAALDLKEEKSQREHITANEAQIRNKKEKKEKAQAEESQEILSNLKSLENPPEEKREAVVVGDYVDYSKEGKKYKEFGTVMKISDGWFTIRPHRTQGDFKASSQQFKVIKDNVSIDASRPRDDEYTINLMWVKKAFDNDDYIFPKEKLDDFFKKLVGWAQKNPKAEIVVWYDSKMVSARAQKNTENRLKGTFVDHAPHISFKDLRLFPQVIAHQEVFSEKTPVYFRVDLFRVISAYNILTAMTANGKKHTFVYGDLDVAPMDKKELFDASTQMDLDNYGISMARGGFLGFENSFQIWANNEPLLLAAVKAAIIDISILRAEYILSGGSWAYKSKGDTKPLEQSVYDSYPDMFNFFYHLKGWAKVYGVGTTEALSRDETEKIFGLRDFKRLPIDLKSIKNKELLFKYRNISPLTAEKVTFTRLYIPTKIIDAPESQFGGKPTTFNPEEISPDNYPEKLGESLKKPLFDSFMLLIAARNNYASVARLIADKLSPDELAEAALTPASISKFRDLSIPLISALDNDHGQIVNVFLEKMGDRKLLIRAVKTILAEDGGQSLLETQAQRGNVNSMGELLKAVSPHSDLLKMIADGLAGKMNSSNALTEAANYYQEDMLNLLFKEFLPHKELLDNLSASLLQKDKLIRLLNAGPSMLGIIKKTFFNDTEKLKTALLKLDSDDNSFIGILAGKPWFMGKLVALAGQMLSDSQFMAQWAKTLSKKNQLEWNIFHKLADNGDVQAIKDLAMLFAEHPEEIKKALQDLNNEKKTPLELATDELTRRTLTEVFGSVQ